MGYHANTLLLYLKSVLITIVTLVVMSTSFGCTQEVDEKSTVPDPEYLAVVKFLQLHFPDKTSWSEDDLLYQDASISKISQPVLDSCLQYGFYKTILTTGYFEYPTLDIIIAIHHDDYDEIEVLESPTFNFPNPEVHVGAFQAGRDAHAFLSLFQGISVENELQERKLAREIVYLMKEITYDGRMADLENPHPNTYSYELWHGDLSWAIIDIVFQENSLSKIEVKGGVKRGKMFDGYRRKKVL